MNSRLALYKEIHRHSKLADKRDPMLESVRYAKAIGWLVAIIVILYFAGMGLLLAMVVNDDKSMSSIGFASGFMPIILLIDFALRFTTTQTPVKQIKPYLLLPISKFACTDCFLVESVVRDYNLIWQALFIPYGLVAIMPEDGILTFIGFIIAAQILILINALWYALARSLISKNFLWWALPVGIYLIIALPLILNINFGENPSKWFYNSFADFGNFYASIGGWLADNAIILWISLAALLALMFCISRIVMQSLVRGEIEQEKSTDGKSTFSTSFIDTRNETMMFTKLEILSITRNKNPKKAFISSVIATIAISLLVSFSSTFAGSTSMQLYWLYYCYGLFPTMYLTNIMSYEGNYIDFLVTHKESIYSLLKAKYYSGCVLMLLPFFLLLPTVVMNVFSLSDLIAYMLFSAGVVNFVYMQLAVYNNQTRPLNTKLTGKGPSSARLIPMLLTSLVFFIPIIIFPFIDAFCGRIVLVMLLSITGLIFIATNHLWLKNIYRRMNKRKYANLENFRVSR